MQDNINLLLDRDKSLKSIDKKANDISNRSKKVRILKSKNIPKVEEQNETYGLDVEDEEIYDLYRYRRNDCNPIFVLLPVYVIINILNL